MKYEYQDKIDKIIKEIIENENTILIEEKNKYYNLYNIEREKLIKLKNETKGHNNLVLSSSKIQELLDKLISDGIIIDNSGDEGFDTPDGPCGHRRNTYSYSGEDYEIDSGSF